MDKNFAVLEFEALPENQSFARAVSAVYCAGLDPTAAELTEIKTAVSEAVSNAIIHGYERKGAGRIRMELSTEEASRIVIKVSDTGKGIGDIAKAMEPLFSTEEEREMSGMGFTVMESFADKVMVESEPGRGTTVTLIKIWTSGMTSKYVPVAKEDTYALIERAQAGDEEAKDLICRQNTGLVKNLALKFAAGEYELDDIIQIGYIGLLKAVYKFQPEYDVMFSTYAVPMIMGEIRRFFRDNGKIKASRALKSEIYNMKRIQEELAAEDGGQPKLSVLAEAMGVTAEHLLEIMEAAQNLSNIASLDNQMVEGECEAYYSQASPENHLDGIVMREEIRLLPKKERQVILLRYYRDMTQQEIAGRLGISQVQVSRLEKRALKAMKQKMGE